MEENINNINQISNDNSKPVSKVSQITTDLKNKVGVILTKVDTSFSGFMPNQKLRKVTYTALGSLFGFMFLIVILGLIFSPLRNTNQQGAMFKKPVILSESPKPQIELTERQKEILKLQMSVNNLRFPESILNIPQIYLNLEI